MRRRKRNRATWLPILPTTFGEGTEGVTWYQNTVTFASGSEVGDTTVASIPLTFDDSATQDASTVSGESPSLRDKVEGQDYTLDRVVGKTWMDTSLLLDTNIVRIVGCIALAVLPSDDSGNPSIPSEEYNPLFARNAMQPWIWRRTWTLDSPGVWPGAQGNLLGYPSSTAYYGSMLDGGHMDTRGSRRRIIKEHRLFLIAAAGIVDYVAPTTDAHFVTWGYDLRLIGGMRRARNNSSF